MPLVNLDKQATPLGSLGRRALTGDRHALSVEAPDLLTTPAGRIAQAELTIEKDLSGGVADGDFDFELVEQDQSTAPVTDDPSNTTNFAVSTTSGSGSYVVGAIEPGLYRLSEVNLPASVEMTDLVCIDQDGESILTSEGLVDLDSLTSATCTITKSPIPTAELTLVKKVTQGDADPAAWTLQASGPDSLSGATGAEAGTSQEVAAGEYTLAESGGPEGYELESLVCVDNDGAELAVAGKTVSLTANAQVTCTFTNADLSAGKLPPDGGNGDGDGGEGDGGEGDDSGATLPDTGNSASIAVFWIALVCIAAGSLLLVAHLLGRLRRSRRRDP